MKSEFPTPLARIRSERGVYLDDLAEAMGCNKAHLSRIENGRGSASPDLANRLAKHFGDGITRDEILFPGDYIPAKATRSMKKAS